MSAYYLALTALWCIAWWHELTVSSHYGPTLKSYNLSHPIGLITGKDLLYIFALGIVFPMHTLFYVVFMRLKINLWGLKQNPQHIYTDTVSINTQCSLCNRAGAACACTVCYQKMKRVSTFIRERVTFRRIYCRKSALYVFSRTQPAFCSLVMDKHCCLHWEEEFIYCHGNEALCEKRKKKRYELDDTEKVTDAESRKNDVIWLARTVAVFRWESLDWQSQLQWSL